MSMFKVEDVKKEMDDQIDHWRVFYDLFEKK